MPPLSDEEFSVKYFATSTPLEKVKLAVREGRFVVVERTDKPNLPDEFMEAVPSLHDGFKVEAKKREFPDTRGLERVYVLKKVPYKEMGENFELYIKGYFRKANKDSKLVVDFLVQSLREDGIVR